MRRNNQCAAIGTKPLWSLVWGPRASSFQGSCSCTEHQGRVSGWEARWNCYNTCRVASKAFSMCGLGQVGIPLEEESGSCE